MNGQDPLAALQPLREPEAIGWWPLAPGWWVLLGLVVLVLGLVTYQLLQRYQRNAYRRTAQRQLQVLTERYRANGDAVGYVQEINALLKSCAIIAFGHDTVSSMHGQQWVEFLNRQLPPSEHFKTDFANAPYTAAAESLNLEAIDKSSVAWIKKHGPQR